MNLLEISIENIQQAMDSESLTAVQLTQYYLDRIAVYDQQGPGLNSIRVLNDDVLKKAAALVLNLKPAPIKWLDKGTRHSTALLLSPKEGHHAY